MNSQECKLGPTIMNIYSNKPLFSPSSILVNKCNDSWNNINGRYAKLWVLVLLKTLILKYWILCQDLIEKLIKIKSIYLGIRLVHLNED